MRSKKIKGQILVEYVLLVSMIFLMTFGLNKIFAKALVGHFKNISKIRSGIAGMGP